VVLVVEDCVDGFAEFVVGDGEEAQTFEEFELLFEALEARAPEPVTGDVETFECLEIEHVVEIGAVFLFNAVEHQVQVLQFWSLDGLNHIVQVVYEPQPDQLESLKVVEF